MRTESDEQRSESRLARRTAGVERSPIREMFDLADQYDDRDLVHLEIGEPDFDTPEHIREAANAALADGATHYTSNAGLPSLRQAIAADITDDQQYAPDSEVIVTAGAMEALALVFLIVVDPGDEVVVPTPAWPNYRTQTAMAGGEFVTVPLDRERGFALAADRIAESITNDTALIMLTSPSNPTGQVYNGQTIERVVEAADEHDAVVVADEVYKDLIYEGDNRSAVEATGRSDCIVTISSCSKTYAMTGWRVGWLAAPTDIVDAAMKFHESAVACAPTISQHAAIAALTGDRSPIREMRDAFRERRDLLLNRVKQLPGIDCPRPEGAFYAFLDFSAVGNDSTTVARQLLEEYGVVTVPGSGFGATVDDHLRLSFANDKARLDEGFDRIEQFLNAEGVQRSTSP